MRRWKGKGQGSLAVARVCIAKFLISFFISYWQLIIRAAFSPEWEPFDEPSVPAGDDASGSTVAAGKYVTSDVDDSVEDGEIGVMSPDCQDPLLAQTYLGLPFLPWVLYGLCHCLTLLIISLSHLCEITSFTGSAESLRTVFSDACAKMTKEEAQWDFFPLVCATYPF